MPSDYDKLYSQFRWEVPEHFNFATDVVDRYASDPIRLALYWLNESGREERYTFAELRDLSNRFANVLAGLGIQRGDVVLVILPRIPAWQVVMLGLLKVGAIAAPGATLLQPKDIAYRADLSEARAVITDIENSPKVDAVRQQLPGLKQFILIGGTQPRWVSYDEEIGNTSSQF